MSTAFDSKRNSSFSDNFHLDVNFYSIVDYNNCPFYLQSLPCQQVLLAQHCKLGIHWTKMHNVWYPQSNLNQANKTLVSRNWFCFWYSDKYPLFYHNCL
jgi:hypothetical protein